jgi:hypothetical protein
MLARVEQGKFDAQFEDDEDEDDEEYDDDFELGPELDQFAQQKINVQHVILFLEIGELIFC